MSTVLSNFGRDEKERHAFAFLTWSLSVIVVLVRVTNSSLLVAENNVVNSRGTNYFHRELYSRASGIDVIGILVRQALLR